MNVLALGRALLALVFLVAGLAKLGNRTGGREAILAFGVPARLASPLVWLLPAAEVLVGMTLLPTATARWGAIGALVLLVLFLAGIGWNLARGRRPACRCFGQLHAHPIGWSAVVRNLGLVALTGTTLAQPAAPIGAGLLGWLDTLTSGESVALGLSLAACGLAAMQAWLFSNLIRQNGRLLLRLDALEARLGDEPQPAAPLPARPSEELRVGLPIGATAPGFAWPDLEGRTVSLEDLRGRGKPVLLLFMDPGCGPCIALIPQVAKWSRELGRTLTIAMLSRGTAEVNHSKIAGHDVGTVLLQPNDDTAEQYQTLGTPSAVVVDREGRVASLVAQGADAIRRLVTRTTRSASPRRLARLAGPAPATLGLVLVAGVTLPSPGAASYGWLQEPVYEGWVLQVEDHTGWQTWWRAESAPEVWREPVRAVLAATRWTPVANGVDLGELVISGGGLALRTRLILARFDPLGHRVVLAQPRARAGKRSAWTIDSAAPDAVLAFNAGQFGEGGPWGWLVREGRELQPPGRGPLSLAMAITSGGAARFASAESLPAVRGAGDVREGFQSYPALLADDGRVPHQLRAPRGPVDLEHRDTRLALCTLRDGRLLVALTRFDNLGRVFGSLPIGFTLGEMSAVMGALGCDRAVSLDGGISAQLLVRPSGRPPRRWAGWRAVPLGVEILSEP